MPNGLKSANKTMNLNFRDDKDFIQRLTEIVEANLGDENFGVSELVTEIGVSRSRLYFRVRSVTQKSASQFIVEISLNKALELLQQSKYNVSEISYQVGWQSCIF